MIKRDIQHIITVSFVLLFFIAACNTNNTVTENDDSFDTVFFHLTKINIDSTNADYIEILNGLKKEYTQKGWDYSKSFHDFYSDSGYNLKTFYVDSINYVNCYKRFFQLDSQFIKWLLSFKNDTTRGRLWEKHKDPIDSYLGECAFSMKNNRAAIILIENYLNGEGIYCFECKHEDIECNENKYKKINSFLAENNELSIDELRDKWKKINTH